MCGQQIEDPEPKSVLVCACGGQISWCDDPRDWGEDK
jgi:hypothetical protein